MTEEKMIGYHHQLNGHESEQTLGDSGGQRSLALQLVGSQRVGHNLLIEQQRSRIDMRDALCSTHLFNPYIMSSLYLSWFLQTAHYIGVK